MLDKHRLKDLLSESKYSNLDKILLILAVEIGIPKKLTDIKKIGTSSGLRAITKWNVSDYLRKSNGKAICIDEGWILTTKGKNYIKNNLGIDIRDNIIIKTANSLRSYISRITDQDIVQFLNEAVSCFEYKNYRAAVVLSWVGAISILQKEVVNHHLTAFNREALHIEGKWRPARNADDICRMKERDFLIILERLSIIGKSVKLELEKCLNLRNSCGHPNSLLIAENNAAAHIETLILNVFSKF